MAIGTTVKVGWDAAAVRTGLGALRGTFGGAMRGLGQIGIGAFRQMGARATDLLGRIVMAIPEGIKDTLDFGGDMFSLSKSTRVAVDELIVLQEALRMSGAESINTAKMISTLAVNLESAGEAGSPVQEALNKLGLWASDFDGKNVAESFEIIGRAVNRVGPGFKGLDGIMQDLFGGRMGYKLIEFFDDFNGSMAEARKNVGPFAARMKESAGTYDKMSDALGRFNMRWKELMSVGIDELVNMFGSNWIDQAFDFLSPEKVRAGIAALKSGFTEFVTWASEGGFKTIFKDIGKMIGDGIMESLKQMNPLGTMWGTIKRGIGGGGMVGPASGDLSQLISQGQEQTAYLRRIADKKGGWA